MNASLVAEDIAEIASVGAGGFELLNYYMVADILLSGLLELTHHSMVAHWEFQWSITAPMDSALRHTTGFSFRSSKPPRITVF